LKTFLEIFPGVKSNNTVKIFHTLPAKVCFELTSNFPKKFYECYD
jgi:hypothetical protein